MTNTEYTVFITCNGGRTYNICVFDNLREAKTYLFNMVDLERERHRPYYVDNDFFDNEYPASLNCKIFCLKEREVTNWEKYIEKNIINNHCNNIINFPNIF